MIKYCQIILNICFIIGQLNIVNKYFVKSNQVFKTVGRKRSSSTYAKTKQIYTRAQAINEGVLVDLSSSFPQDTKMFKWNVACTDIVWTLIERAAEADGGADVAAYVYEVCFMAGMAIKTLHDAVAPELFFKVMLPLRENGTER